jgi:hypothetical protein
MGLVLISAEVELAAEVAIYCRTCPGGGTLVLDTSRYANVLVLAILSQQRQR